MQDHADVRVALLVAPGARTFVPRACEPPKMTVSTYQSASTIRRTRSRRLAIVSRCVLVSVKRELNSLNALIPVVAIWNRLDDR
jgi:hypothetical protein